MPWKKCWTLSRWVALVESLKGRKPPAPVLQNTCYSMVAPKYAVSVANLYRITDKGLVSLEGGVSPTGQTAQFHSQEATYAEGWYSSITQEMFG